MMAETVEKKLLVDDCLNLLSEEFTPDELYSRVDVGQYAKKLSDKAFFLLDQEGNKTRGFIAYYLNNDSSYIFITRIAVSNSYRRQGIGRKMIETLTSHYMDCYESIELEVEKTNKAALEFYQSLGFQMKDNRTTKYLMRKSINCLLKNK